MEIRPLRADELEEGGRATALAYGEFASPGHEGWGEYLARIADAPARARRAVVLGAVEDGRVLGTVTLELDQRIEGGHPRPPLRPGEAHVRMLGVHPDARRRGIGRALMDACIEEARRAGKTHLSLETTPDMAAARRMYEGMGFARGEDVVYDDGFRLLAYELEI